MKFSQVLNIYFLGEQDGKAEQEFKETLYSVLAGYDKSLRAYLARVKYKENDNSFVALCFRVEEEIDKYLLVQSTKIFRMMFGEDEHLDIIFLNEQQESQLRKVCCPFFISLNYQFNIPDFFLTSSESYSLKQPIACFKRKRLHGKNPDGYLLCDTEPFLMGEGSDENETNITQIVLASRHQGYSVFLIRDWPAYVHIAIPLGDLSRVNDIKETDIKLIAWGELYENESDASKMRL